MYARAQYVPVWAGHWLDGARKGRVAPLMEGGVARASADESWLTGSGHIEPRPSTGGKVNTAGHTEDPIESSRGERLR